MCHHHLSETHNLSALASLFISHILHFARSIPITIYTLSSRAPTHRYLHTFPCLLTHCTHHSRAAQIVLDIQQHRCGWQLTPISRQKPSINGANTTRCKPCQLSAVSRQLSAVVHFAQGVTPLGRFQRSKNTTICTVFVLRIPLAPLLLPLIPSLCTTYTHHRPDSTTTYIRHPLRIRSASIKTPFLRSHTTIYRRKAPFRGLHSHHRLHAFGARPQIALFARFSMTIHTPHTHHLTGTFLSLWGLTHATCTLHTPHIRVPHRAPLETIENQKKRKITRSGGGVVVCPPGRPPLGRHIPRPHTASHARHVTHARTHARTTRNESEKRKRKSFPVRGGLFTTNTSHPPQPPILCLHVIECTTVCDSFIAG